MSASAAWAMAPACWLTVAVKAAISGWYSDHRAAIRASRWPSVRLSSSAMTSARSPKVSIRASNASAAASMAASAGLSA